MEVMSLNKLIHPSISLLLYFTYNQYLPNMNLKNGSMKNWVIKTSLKDTLWYILAQPQSIYIGHVI